MNTNTELIEYAKRLKIPLRFISTKDNLTKLVPIQNGLYIINLQDDYNADGEDQTGSHWVCFWIEGNKSVFFNSFGLAPPAEVQLYLYKFKPFMYNENQIQNIMSGWCGIYCLAFGKYMMKKELPLQKRFQKFLELFKEDPEKNLTMLKKIMGGSYFQ